MQPKGNKKVCPECGQIMNDQGIDVQRWDTGEHFLCYNEHYWACPDPWCGGSQSEAIGDSWNEPYEDETASDLRD